MTSIRKHNRANPITIDFFNKCAGQETLHPLVSLVSSPESLAVDWLHGVCDFYGLVCGRQCIKFIHPGEQWVLPAEPPGLPDKYIGVLFHPDLLYETTLEEYIDTISLPEDRQMALSEHDRQILSQCLQEMERELHHAIDAHSRTIIVSYIELLFNYCIRCCHAYR